MRSWICRGLACLGLILSWAGSVAAQSAADAAWPQFRGPNVDGTSPERGVFPTDEFGLGVAWRATVGEGIAGVAIASGLAVTMGQSDEKMWVIALDEDTGEEQWRYALAPAFNSTNGTYNGPFSTPLVSGNAVVALDMAGRLAGLDLVTGDLLWSVDLPDELDARRPQSGFTTSPVSVDGTVVVEIGAEDAAVAGFDPASGTLLWTVGTDQIMYQTPVPMRLHGVEQVVAAGQTNLMGIDPRSGELLWQHPHNGDGFTGIQSMTPVAAGPGRLFLANKHHSSALVDLEDSGGDIVASERWEQRTIRNSFTVPVYHDGYIYGYSSRFLVCADAETGETVWRSRPPGDGWLMLVDGHLVIVTKEGSLHVIKASPDGYEQVASLELFDDPSWTHPGFANGHIYARSYTEVARVDIRRVSRLTDAGEGDTGLAGPDGRFAQFLRDVARAGDKTVVVDRFLDSVDQFPFVETDTLVHFLYRGPATDVAIAGDIIGVRLERPMTRVEGTDLFYYTVELDPAARVNYHFIPDYEETIDPRNSRTTTTMVYGPDMEVLFLQDPMAVSWMSMPRWAEPQHLANPPPNHARGSLARHELESEWLGGDIVLDVYLPPGYEENGEERYPVAYYYDGAGALSRGEIVTSLDNLVGTEVRPLIAVFVTGTVSSYGDAPPNALAEEVVPFVDGTYRTVAEANSRAVVGQGFMAPTAIRTGQQKPDVFGKVGVQSVFWPSMTPTYITDLVRSPAEQPLDLYIEWGLYDARSPDEKWSFGEISRMVRDSFVSQGHAVSGGEVPDGTGWSSWKNRTDVVLSTLFPLQ